MELKEIVEFMLSDKHEDRFIAEYQQLDIRIKKLTDFLEKYKNGELNFKTACDYDLLHSQLAFMKAYQYYLGLRADIEDIDVDI